MASTPLTILIIGGAGVQNSEVARQVSANKAWTVKLLSRDITNEECRSLDEIENITLIQGDCYDDDTLIKAYEGVHGVFVNTNGFAIGEKSEMYWSIRMYELAYWAGIKHFVYSSLPYALKTYGFDPKYRVPFMDAKGKVVEFLRHQPTDVLNWSAVFTGPYAESLWEGWAPSKEEDGTYKFWLPIGQGAMPFVPLKDVGWYVRHIFENPNDFKAVELKVGAEHATGPTIVAAFEKVTGKKAVFEPRDIDEHCAKYPEFKIGQKGSPGFDDPTLLTISGHFKPWLTIMSKSAGNPADGAWHKDYDLLDKIHPNRIKTIEEWMRSVNYTGDVKPVLKTGLQ